MTHIESRIEFVKMPGPYHWIPVAFPVTESRTVSPKHIPETPWMVSWITGKRIDNHIKWSIQYIGNTNSIAIGSSAGQTNQSFRSVAIGNFAGQTNQQQFAVAVGQGAGYTGQGGSAVAIGRSAGYTGQGASAVAVGLYAGQTGQGASAVAIGQNAGLNMEDVIEVISKGAAQSWQMENRYKTMIQDKFDFGFAVDWMRKDLGIAMEEAKNNGSDLPITKIIDGYYSDVQKNGGNRFDTSSLITRLKKK